MQHKINTWNCFCFSKLSMMIFFFLHSLFSVVFFVFFYQVFTKMKRFFSYVIFFKTVYLLHFLFIYIWIPFIPQVMEQGVSFRTFQMYYPQSDQPERRREGLYWGKRKKKNLSQIYKLNLFFFDPWSQSVSTFFVFFFPFFSEFQK